MTTLQSIAAANNWNLRVNENFASSAPAALYGVDPSATTGLTLAYLGGQFNGVTVANGTITLTASATNYVVANLSTGVVSVATTTTNWLATTTYLQLYQAVAGASTVTALTDMRQAIGAAGSGSGGMANPMTTTGDMIYSSPGSNPVRLGIGSNGQVMTLASGLPTWAAAPSGGFTGGTLASALNEAPTVTIASSATPAIGAAAGNTISLTGTTTVTGFDAIAAGAFRRVIFAGALVLTHNATSLILPTAASLTTAAGDVAEFLSLGAGNWRCTSYSKVNGTALAGSAAGLTWNAQTASYTLAIGDANNGVEQLVAAANNLTIPLNATVAFPVGTSVLVYQAGAGLTTIVATAGVTVVKRGSSLAMGGQYALATLVKRATDTWILSGDIAP
jgi:hypothetical protein